MANCAGIADTGTTMCMLPEFTFQTYKEEVGAKLDPFTWPRSQNENLGIPKDAICLIFASMGQMENKRLDFINGYTFLQVRFHFIFVIAQYSFCSLSV
ncbi:hypothetical protein B0H14DRAFT_3656457 [Mycena olivaceomarginata]|nr:hypothetical protein B0H14DRAFT_3656457 [Mycena olivaceomarginata]